MSQTVSAKCNDTAPTASTEDDIDSTAAEFNKDSDSADYDVAP